MNQEASIATTNTNTTVTTATKTSWYQGLLTPQTFMLLLAGMFSITVFWIKTEASWERNKQQDELLELKADKADAKALEDRVGRQYELMNKLGDRITVLEKQLEYQRGLKDAEDLRKAVN